MDYSILVGPVQALLGALSTILWFLLIETKKKAEKNEADLASYKIHVAETYSTTSELKEALRDINKTFEAYGTKLDGRLDRIEGRINKVFEQGRGA